ncbi:MAG TPA: hypothetical protein VF671_23375 [Pseudomonas sp.]|jgi:hypothetical protein|uniref:hypothetical protein n=1 Tax=Pseudomonas sp. TaxID=306 RepID=UPI002ED84FBE
MNLDLSQDQIDQLTVEAAKVALEQGADAVGAYASTYAMILGFIDPAAAVMLTLLKSPDSTLNAITAAQMATKLELLDANVRDIAIWLVGAYMVGVTAGPSRSSCRILINRRAMVSKPSVSRMGRKSR